MPIIIDEKVINEVRDSNRTVNEVLSDRYANEIEERKSKNSLFENMTPMQMALADAKITKNTHLGDINNAASQTYTTQQATEFLVPTYIDTTLHEFISKNDILQYIVKTEIPEKSIHATSCYLDMNDPENKSNSEMSLVDEGADMPLAMLRLGETAIRLRKYGRAVEQTYEALSQFTVDMFTKTLQMISQDASNQMLRRATNVALKGDGNNNAAKGIAINTTAVATDDLKLIEELNKAFIKYNRMSGLPLTTIIAGGDTFIRLSTLATKTDVANGVGTRYILNTPQFPNSNIALVDYGDAEIKVGSTYNKNGIILLNKDMSLTKHFLNGSRINEYATNIRNQTKLGTISEIAGFSKNTPDGVMYVQTEK